MATFVDIASEDDQLSELATYFNKIQAGREGAQDFTQLAKNNKIKELLPHLIEKLDLVFTEATEKDAEAVFNLIFSLLRKLDAASVDDLAKKVTTKITSTNDKPLLRIRLLNNLYNTFDTDSISRYETFVAIVQYALDSKNNEIVIPTFKRIDEWLKIWGANLEQTRRLYKLIVRIIDEFSKPTYRFPENTTKDVLSYNLLIKYLQTFTSADQEALASAKPDAIKAAVHAIKTPEIHQCDDLLEIPAVKQLSTDTTHSRLYELLRLFSADKLDSFTTFHESNPQYLESLGLSHDDCVKKIRLLSLASLGIEHQEVPYSLIAKTLKIEEDDVESWVILSIRAGLLDAKLDQLRRVAIIIRATQRVFTPEQWKNLGARINGWKENVRSIRNIQTLDVTSLHQKAR